MSPEQSVKDVFGPNKGWMERAMGIEPTSEAWEASILPLYDARSFLTFRLYINCAERTCSQPFRMPSGQKLQ